MTVKPVKVQNRFNDTYVFYGFFLFAHVWLVNIIIEDNKMGSLFNFFKSCFYCVFQLLSIKLQFYFYLIHDNK